LQRIIKAYINSMAAFRQLLAHEKAFQQELAVLIASVPAAFFMSDNGLMRLLLVGMLVLVLVVEVLNTGIEAACNAITREHDLNIKIAKDCGSLAVLLSIALAVGVWGLAAWRWFFG
jgi:diacylglycerol kinase (ATP)